MPKAYLIDMHGVLISGAQVIPGAVEFLERLREAGARFVLLTNNSRFTPRDHQARLGAMGLEVDAGSIFTSALREIGAHSEETVMIGDRMDTDIVAGIESGMETALVLSGVTARKDVDRYPYKPGRIVNSVADIVP